MFKIIATVLLLMVYQISVCLPKGFVYLHDIDPSIAQDMRYSSTYNFVGRPIKGYQAPTCILTEKAALRLKKIQKQLLKKQLSLKVYDCYRPVQAVKDFLHWSHDDDKSMKKVFYPREKKSQLFKRGYIAKYSGHSRGSTVDLTIISNESTDNIDEKRRQLACFKKSRRRDNSLDMGTNFDCLDTLSYFRSATINKDAQENRRYLRYIMGQGGFRPYSKEWWHFTLRQEPYPRTYFSFPVK